MDLLVLILVVQLTKSLGSNFHHDLHEAYSVIMPRWWEIACLIVSACRWVPNTLLHFWCMMRIDSLVAHSLCNGNICWCCRPSQRMETSFVLHRLWPWRRTRSWNAQISFTEVWCLLISLLQMTYLRKQRQRDALLECSKPCVSFYHFSECAILNRRVSPISYEPLPYR